MRDFLSSPMLGSLCTVPLIVFLTVRQFVDTMQGVETRRMRTRWEYRVIASLLLSAFGVVVLLRFAELSF